MNASLAHDPTLDPSARSWVASANTLGADFPIQNLPFGLAHLPEGDRILVAIGDQALNLVAALEVGALADLPQVVREALRAPVLNPLMGLEPRLRRQLRQAIFDALHEDSAWASTLGGCLVPQAGLHMRVPARIGDYTDFYTSIHHATSVGRLFRPDNPLLPNYKWVPIGYHGRSSSIGVSGQTFARPCGQTMPPGATTPVFGPSQRLDYELELGVFVAGGNEPGEPIPIEAAESHVFGLCLLNDWSARDLQAWEYQPLGPFLAKNFATTISPWIVTLDALAPFRCEWTRSADDPQPLPYLESPANRAEGSIDMMLEVLLLTEAMHRAGEAPVRLSLGNFRHAYWTIAQMVTHHAVNGCNLQPGDLLGTGTQSGPQAAEAGSLLELTAGGRQPITLPNGETRTFLQDGDEVILRGWCEREGAARIGLGEVRGKVLPARR